MVRALDALTAPVVCPEQKLEISIGWDCGQGTDSQQADIASKYRFYM